ncbi:STAS domain-containing protein [Streptomyces sp. NPDC058401]|uniref:STAS domain-containing protein n=1 Tax=Streptomyces sp. NPDC058401 TaxID=3346480 RepID=UPI0036499CF0
MNSVPPSPLQLTYVDADDTVRIELHGDFDYESADDLLDAVVRILQDRTGLKDLHLHCGNLTAVDSTGLSTLLMIRRHTDSAGVQLHIVDRPVCLDRILELTGTLHHLTARPTGQAGLGTYSHTLRAKTADTGGAAAEEPVDGDTAGPGTAVHQVRRSEEARN